MTKKPLLDVVFASEKRMKVVMMLQKGPQEMETLLRVLDTTRAALLPQIRILEDHFLVTDSSDVYELTRIGELIVEQMTSLTEMTEFFDVDINYWGTHSLDFIPPHLLNSMGKVENCEIVSPPLTDMYDIHKTFETRDRKTEFVYTFTAFLYPNYQQVFSELVDSKVQTCLIVSEELLAKIKTDYYADFKELLKSNYFRLFAYTKTMHLLGFSVDDFHIFMALLKKNGDFDNKYVLCRGIDLVDWGKELFEYYLKDSEPVQIDDL